MQLKNLENHLALVTGSAGGIGLCFAKELASRGASLMLVDLNEEGLKRAETEIHALYPAVKIYCLTLDLTDAEVSDKMECFCVDNGLEPDILINNAGIFSFKEISDTDEKKLETFINLHIRTVTLLSRWFVRKRRPFREGYMLNMSSMSCWMPMPGLAMYASTKAYIRVFSRSLHYEVKEQGIGVTVACPGGIATDLFGLPPHLQKFAVRIGVLDTPVAFARKAVNKMLKHKKQYINGWLNRFSIFFVSIMPSPVRMMVKHHLLDKGIRR